MPAGLFPAVTRLPARARGKRVHYPRAPALDFAPNTRLDRLDDTSLQGPSPTMTGRPVDLVPCWRRQACGRLSCETPHGKQRRSSRCAAAVSAGHTRGKAAALQRGAQRDPFSTPLQRGMRFLPRPFPAPPFPALARGRLRGLRRCTASERASGVPRSASCTDKSGEDASVPREGPRVRRLAVQTHRPALPAILALGPEGGSSPARVTMRHTKAAAPCSRPTISRR